jgi:SNW domain-containing protein 1
LFIALLLLLLLQQQQQGSGGGGASGDGLYDSRLFNQSAGMSSGFGDDADYAVYSK